ncbi:hypothetical protein U9M48_030950 [Paspalum notatum var. saurae]|uniref:Uncharacterized protein n=1 Tax=Paspalum notatum var. saurae TaxID=547442 RepID=A0AAQ3U2P1_PASNO
MDFEMWVHIECDGMASVRKSSNNSKLTKTSSTRAHHAVVNAPREACQPAKYLSALAMSGLNASSLSLVEDRGSPKYVWGKPSCLQPKHSTHAAISPRRRRDVVDHDLMVSLRAAATLPSLEDISPSSPNSDDEKLGAYVLKNDVSLHQKHLSGKTVSKSSESNEKPSKKKGGQGNKTDDVHDEIFLERRHDARSSIAVWEIKNDGNAYISSSARSSENNLKSPSIKAVASNAEMTQSEENAPKNDTGKGTKVVIHLGSRHKTRSGSPKSELSNSQREQDLGSVHGGKIDVTSQLKSSRSEIKERSVMKLVRETGAQQRNSLLGDLGTSKKHATGKRSTALISGMVHANEIGTKNGSFGQKQSHSSHVNENHGTAAFSSDSPDNLKPSLLKLKFNRPHFETPNSQASQPEDPTSWASQQDEQLNVAKGQRSKRKRPSMDKADGSDGMIPAKRHQQSTDDKVMDANWILRKLGKDAIGKRIEVHLTSDDKWHQGVVSNVIGSTLCIQLYNGRSENVELGKQAIRLIASRSKGGKR